MNHFNIRQVIILCGAVGLFFLSSTTALCAYWKHYTPSVTTPHVVLEGGEGYVTPVVSSGSPTNVNISWGAYASAEDIYIPYLSGDSGAYVWWELAINLQLMDLAPGEYADVSVTGNLNAIAMANGEEGLGNTFPGTGWGTGVAKAASAVTLNLSTSTGITQQYYRDIYIYNDEDFDKWASTPGHPNTPADTIIFQCPMVNGDIVFMNAVFGLYSEVSIDTVGEVKAETYGEFTFDVLAEVKNVNPQVPIPGAVWLLGTGLISLVGLRRKFKR